jgi:hypothetical protein
MNGLKGRAMEGSVGAGRKHIIWIRGVRCQIAELRKRTSYGAAADEAEGLPVGRDMLMVARYKH